MRRATYSRPVRLFQFHHDSMDKLGLMEIFVRIVETGSFSAVAREMAMSQPTVSKQIGALERSLKTRLLNRTTRSLSLTEAGAAYYERCRKIIDQVQAAETSLGAFQGKLTGTLSINSSVAFGQMFLTQLVPEPATNSYILLAAIGAMIWRVARGQRARREG